YGVAEIGHVWCHRPVMYRRLSGIGIRLFSRINCPVYSGHRIQLSPHSRPWPVDCYRCAGVYPPTGRRRGRNLMIGQVVGGKYELTEELGSDSVFDLYRGKSTGTGEDVFVRGVEGSVPRNEAFRNQVTQLI